MPQILDSRDDGVSPHRFDQCHLPAGEVTTKQTAALPAPNVFFAGTPERVCLTLFDVPETGNLTLTFRRSESSPTFAQHTQQVSGVAAPSAVDYTISGSLRVRIYLSDVPEEHHFLQTDKYIYKAGQLVRFRVFSVDSNLRPISEPLPQIYIESPAGTRVAQWTDVTGQSGLVQLGDAAGRGTQSVAGRKVKKTFKVEEFVLPRFEVNIQGPPFILGDAEEVAWKVCGRYTYDKPVQGKATIRVTTDGYAWWHYFPSTHIQEKHTSGDDCVVFHVRSGDLSFGFKSRSLEVTAELTEDGTDVTINSTKTFTVEYQKLKLDTENQRSKYFKPGLPFADQITVRHPDNTPAPGELVRLCFETHRTTTDLGITIKSSADPVCLNVTSDSKGVVAFTLPPQDQKIEDISIQATIPRLSETRYPYGGSSWSFARRYWYPSTWMRSPRLKYNVEGWSSESGAFVQLLRLPRKEFTCGTEARIDVFFTTRLGSQFELFYQVMANSDILLADLVPVTFSEAVDASALQEGRVVNLPTVSGSHPVGQVALAIPVTSSMSSGFHVLVYMVIDGEVIADSQSYAAERCLDNQVSLSWSPDRVQPRDTVHLTVTAAPRSLCGLDVVDKSVSLLGDKSKITLSDIYESLRVLTSRVGISQINDDEYCRAKHGLPLLSDPPGSPPARRRRPFQSGITSTPLRRYSWASTHADSLTAFGSSSVMVLSDLVTEARNCIAKILPYYPRRPTFASGAIITESDWAIGAGISRPFSTATRQQTTYSSYVTSTKVPDPVPSVVVSNAPAPPPSEVPDEVRTDFRETWLFDLYTVGDDGSVTLTQKVPDTITEWVGGAVCSSETAGLGVAPSASLTSFQPFFVSYTLPYSVKRGETLVLKVSVLNYNEEALPVKLTLVASDEFETLSAPVVTSCVSTGVAEVVPYRLRPGQLGDVNITVVAEVYSDFPAECGSEVVPYFRDAVTRPILVEPEGFEHEVSHSFFMCISPEGADLSSGPNRREVDWPLLLPADLVPDSERAQIAVVGDLLGPSIDNLESLVRQPTGCGEQNMVLFVPNIHVMKYLTAVGELTERIKDKLVSFMRSGYQRELGYRHEDKSYSAFGKSDASGSMWLTSFVIKSFGDAKEFIFIDESDLEGSVRWIESHQLGNGCFPSVGTVLYKQMKGGVGSGGQQALTAYITIALLQSGIELGENTVHGAFRCLTQDISSDLYTLTLLTHARAVAGRLDEARFGLTELKSRATREEGLVYWRNEGSDENRALSVEMGAYNILTMKLLEKAGDDRSEHLTDALGAVRWITQQRNSRGGFVSTQDTVLALEALAAFSADLLGSSSTDLRVRVSDDGSLNDVINVTADNLLLMQTRDVTLLPGHVHVRAQGTGCALVQASLKYNVHTAGPNDALTIKVTTKPKMNQRECLKHTIDICVSYLKEDSETNMAVVELDMVSGFIPNKGSLNDLKQNVELDLKRWEVNNNKVVFYFDSLGGKERCFGIIVQREQEVEDAKRAVASAYDYYQTEFARSASYALDVNCDTVLL
ncbi:alpha-2-macroglobulin-like [Pollicipes pollicipes]|uniref:alpha-2-macroglobulin-like n=1 Tax=Pollicipes pollicipes TaxID=41117 RepID=UPI001884995A|nr:alpha-2-macroglobulin-like [Pollicipes pollicipes]